MRYAAVLFDYAGVLTDLGMPEVVEAIHNSGLRTALLSNADTQPSVQDGLFDVVAVSGELGLAKPDPAVFRLVAQMLGVEAASCVFVDDLAANVRGAAAAGMVGVHHHSTESTMDELTVLLRLDRL